MASIRYMGMFFMGCMSLCAGNQYQDYTLISPITAEHRDVNHVIIRVPIIKATEETVKGYGRIVPDKDMAVVDITTWPAQGWRTVTAGTGKGGGTIQELYEVYWEYGSCYAVNHKTKVKYLIGWLTDEKNVGTEHKCGRRVMVTSEADYHPDSGQLLFPLEQKPFFLLLALPGDDVKPQDFKAFYFDGIAGFHINAGVWHQLAFPVDISLQVHNQQGSIFACVDCDFIQEFDCLLAIDLDFFEA